MQNMKNGLQTQPIRIRFAEPTQRKVVGTVELISIMFLIGFVGKRSLSCQLAQRDGSRPDLYYY